MQMVDTSFVDGLEVGSSGSEKLTFADGMVPSEYLRFATLDVEESFDPRACINGITNAKRALHLRLENLAIALGGEHVKICGKSNFPDLLGFVGRCGVVAPRVLSRLNKVRVEVEHRYYIPRHDQVEDFIDVVALFLSATDRLISEFPTSIDFYLEEIELGGLSLKSVCISMKPRSGVIQIRTSLVDCDVQKLKMEAEAELLRLEVAAENGEVIGSDDLLYENPLNQAFRNVARKYRVESDVSYHAAKDNLYFDWIAVLLKGLS